MKFKSVLLDILKHTVGLGIIENIKISGNDDTTTLAAIDKEKTVILTAELHNVVPEFKGTFGMGNLAMLSSLTRLSNYQENDVTITIERKEENGEEIPVILVFKDSYGNSDQYRFMSKKVVEEAIKTATFRGAIWNVQFEPELHRINQLNEEANIYANIDPTFSVKTENGNLIFEVGSNEGGVIGRRVFAENIEGVLSTIWRWPFATFLNILKLGGTTIIRFSDQGACQIDIDSGLGIYSYIMPAISR